MTELHVYPSHVKTFYLRPKTKTGINELLSFPIGQAMTHIQKWKINHARKKLKEARTNRETTMWQDSLDYWRTWDGLRRHFKNDTFPIGFLTRVKKYLFMLEPDFLVKDYRTIPMMLPKNFIFKGKLRPDQLQVFNDNIKHERIILNLATGYGKTVLAINLICLRNVRTVIVVPNTVLVNQWIKQIQRFSNIANISYLGYAGGRQFKAGYVFVVSQQTLSSALNSKSVKPKTMEKHRQIQQIWQDAEHIVIDEVHHAAAKTWRSILEQSNAYYRTGLSATVEMRSDQQDHEYFALMGEKTEKISIAELIDLGLATPVHVYFHEIPFKYYDHKWSWGKHGDTKSIEEDYIMHNIYRNQKITDVALDKGIRRNKQILITFNRVPHIERVNGMVLSQLHRKDLKMFNPDESQVAFVHGAYGKKQRIEIYDSFIKKEIKILGAQYQLVGEGWDVSGIEVIFNAMGGKSPIQLEQQPGRGVRLDEGKEFLELHDFADQGKLVTAHSQLRAKAYYEKGFKLKNINDTYLGNLFL